MGSNVAFALRSILRKNLPSDFKSRTKLDPANENAVTTLLSFALMIPIVLLFEVSYIMKYHTPTHIKPLVYLLFFLVQSPSKIMDTFSAVGGKTTFLINTFVCGMCFFLYNEMQVNN